RRCVNGRGPRGWLRRGLASLLTALHQRRWRATRGPCAAGRTLAPVARHEFVIAQLSDLHCGSPYFDAELLATAVNETLALEPDLVVIGGDLTTEGYAHEFRTAQEHLDPLFDRGLN